MSGGTIRYLLECAGCQIIWLAPLVQLKTGRPVTGQHLRIALTRHDGIGLQHHDRVLSIHGRPHMWLVDEDDGSTMDHADIIALVLHVHGRPADERD